MASAEIRKSLVAVVSVYRKSLLIDVGHEKVLAPVLVKIRRINTHARASQPIFAVPYARSQADLLEFLTAPIHEQKVRHRVVGDRKSTRLNSSHRCISYAVFCLKKKIRQ